MNIAPFLAFFSLTKFFVEEMEHSEKTLLQNAINEYDIGSESFTRKNVTIFI